MLLSYFQNVPPAGGQSFLRLRTHLSLILYTYRNKKSFPDMDRSILMSVEFHGVDLNLALLLPYSSPTSMLLSYFQNVTPAGGQSFLRLRTHLSLILYTYRNKKSFPDMGRSILLSEEYPRVDPNLALLLP